MGSGEWRLRLAWRGAGFARRGLRTSWGANFMSYGSTGSPRCQEEYIVSGLSVRTGLEVGRNKRVSGGKVFRRIEAAWCWIPQSCRKQASGGDVGTPLQKGLPHGPGPLLRWARAEHGDGPENLWFRHATGRASPKLEKESEFDHGSPEEPGPRGRDVIRHCRRRKAAWRLHPGCEE